MLEAPASSMIEEGVGVEEKDEIQRGSRRPDSGRRLQRESWSERGGRRGIERAGLPAPSPAGSNISQKGTRLLIGPFQAGDLAARCPQGAGAAGRGRRSESGGAERGEEPGVRLLGRGGRVGGRARKPERLEGKGAGQTTSPAGKPSRALSPRSVPEDSRGGGVGEGRATSSAGGVPACAPRLHVCGAVRPAPAPGRGAPSPGTGRSWRRREASLHYSLFTSVNRFEARPRARRGPRHFGPGMRRRAAAAARRGSFT